jgi:hypothetical protein
VALHTQLPLLHTAAPAHAPLAAFCHAPIALQNCGVFEAHRVGVGFGAQALHAPW